MRRPWRAIAVWLVFVVLALAAGAATGTDELQIGAVDESARGYDLIEQHGAWTAAREYGYLHSDTLTARDPAFRAAVAKVAGRLRTAVGGTVETRVSNDRHSVLVAGIVQQYIDTDQLRHSILAVGAAHPDVTVEQTGEVSASEARDRIVDRDLQRAELLSVPVTLVVLLFAFGAIVAALVPVLLALTAVAAAFGLLGPLSQAFPLDDAVKTVVVLIGMAVGVDYALFYVIRSREERRRGRSSHDALERTA
jgi:putative drug exporter of the RND superfamily